MGVIDNGSHSFLRTNRLETSVHRAQCTKGYQNVFSPAPHTNGSSVHSQQVGYIETAYERNAHLFAIDIQAHAFKRLFQHLCLEIGSRAQRISLHDGLCVLHHDHSVAVVHIRHGKSPLGQTVEKCLLGVAVVLECLMVIQMVTRKVRKNTSCKLQACNTMLGYCMRTDFHESVFASFVRHTPQQTVQRNRVGRGMLCRDSLIIYIIANRRTKSALITEHPEHII